VSQSLLFQHDGAEHVRKRLDTKYPGRWIGRRGPVVWPPRWPRLSAVDVFLKEHVCAVPPSSIDDLMASLQAVVTAVNANMLRRVPENAVWRAAICLDIDGGRLEHLL
jgi:hypothetical protein